MPEFGAWSTASFNTRYQAATDGFVVAYSVMGEMEGSHNILLIGYTDSTLSDGYVVTRRIDSRGYGENHRTSADITMPVRKGDYWRVFLNAFSSGDYDFDNGIFWIPLGN